MTEEAVPKFERLMNLVAFLLASPEPVPFAAVLIQTSMRLTEPPPLSLAVTVTLRVFVLEPDGGLNATDTRLGGVTSPAPVRVNVRTWSGLACASHQ